MGVRKEGKKRQAMRNSWKNKKIAKESMHNILLGSGKVHQASELHS